uniref:ARAD1D07480p n=1 Tax=Blastobotrys adeninivorans TaxID=409370 RepID=A0A060TEH5_BLAAD
MLKELLITSPLLFVALYILYDQSRAARPADNQDNQDGHGQYEELAQDGVADGDQNAAPGYMEDMDQLEDEFDLEGDEEDMGEREGDDGSEGNQPGPSRRNRNRIVGAKKAKSLHRRDQIRAYNEYVRQRAQEEREAQRLWEEQYGDQIASEKAEREERNKRAERERQARLARAREEEEARLQAQQSSTSRLQSTIESRGQVQLRNEEDFSAAQRLANGTDLFIVGPDSDRWLVRVDDDQLKTMAKSIEASGFISFNDLAKQME